MNERQLKMSLKKATECYDLANQKASANFGSRRRKFMKIAAEKMREIQIIEDQIKGLK